MSDAFNRTQAAGGDVAEVLEEHQRKLEGISDLKRELLNIHQEILTERKLADDRHETLYRKLDGIDKKLDMLSMKLSMNGSGDGHA